MKRLQPVNDGSHRIVSGEPYDLPSVSGSVVPAVEAASTSLHLPGHCYSGSAQSHETASGHFTTTERQAAVEHVLSQLCSGRSVRSILVADRACPGLPRLPNISSWWRWISEDQCLAEHLARAREFGIEALLDECIDIADNMEEEPGSRRIRVETRMKLAQMMKPRSYSPRLDLATDQPTMGLAERLAVARKRVLEGR
jgi:hypothetical protein